MLGNAYKKSQGDETAHGSNVCENMRQQKASLRIFVNVCVRRLPPTSVSAVSSARTLARSQQ